MVNCTGATKKNATATKTNIFSIRGATLTGHPLLFRFSLPMAFYFPGQAKTAPA